MSVVPLAIKSLYRFVFSIHDYVKNSILQAAMQYIPTSIQSVLYFPDDSRYCLIHLRLLNKGRLPFEKNMSGFYILRFWSGQGQQYFYLSAHKLSEILQLRDLHTWWALREDATYELLQSYIHERESANRAKCFGLVIDGVCVMSTLKHYMPTILLDGNITAEALCWLYFHETSRPLPVKNGESAVYSVTVIDYDLNEVVRTGKELLFPPAVVPTPDARSSVS